MDYAFDLLAKFGKVKFIVYTNRQYNYPESFIVESVYELNQSIINLGDNDDFRVEEI